MAGSVGWSPWRVVVGFGVVSLLADMVYEGARAMYGPILATLGASALVVGVVSGAGEAIALVLRLVFGPLADRTGAYWSLTLVGYAMTAICVPLLALSPALGAAAVAFASALILAERGGKAVRSPSKTTLLAHAAGAVGRGRGFGVHKALDQLGSLSGPLLVAAVVGAAGEIWPAMAVLAVPGALALLVLLGIRARVPDLALYDGTSSGDDGVTRPELRATAVEADVPPVAGEQPLQGADPGESAGVEMIPGAAPGSNGGRASLWLAQTMGAELPRRFFLLALASGTATAGLVTFGVISYHLATAGLVEIAAVPVVYAAAMAVAAVAALVTGYAYDRWHARVLYLLPALVAGVPALAFSGSAVVAISGVLVWGAAVGLQDSTAKALVADLVPAARRATAYGVFAAVQGVAAIAGGVIAGALYATALPALVAIVAILQVGTAALLAATLRSAPEVAPGR